MESSYWLFTWRTYGSWLPGQEGFVGHYRAPSGRRVIDHDHGTPTAADSPGLEGYVRSVMRAAPVVLSPVQADAVLAQLHETARFRGRVVVAVAVLATHVHLVFGAPGLPDSARMLADWKGYASRALSLLTPEAVDSVWWAEKGSKRRLLDENSVNRATSYVRDQLHPLTTWVRA